MFEKHILLLNILTLFSMLFMFTVIGRVISCTVPFRFRAIINTFFSPILGMACMVLISTWLGRTSLGLVHPVLNQVGLFILILIGLLSDKHPIKLITHASLIAVFGLFCAIPFFMQLFLYGGYNAHNDVFTYLVHSDWLQLHFFNQPVSVSEVTPATTQVVIYQANGFRMGSSYLFAFFQSVFHVQWAYLLYPSIVLAPLVAGIWSIGGLVSWCFPKLNWIDLVLILLLPAYSLGGLVFGSFHGFLAQTYGIALGAACMFLLGFYLFFILKNKLDSASFLFAIPVSVCFSSVSIAYSEFSIFILAVSSFTFLVFMFQTQQYKKFLYLGLILLTFSCILINFEFPRIIRSIVIQSGVVVGGAVDWPILGYLSHMLSVHGGASDVFQWTLHKQMPVLDGLLITGVIFLCLIIVFKTIKNQICIKNIALLPSFYMIFLLLIGILYFRYVVANPFSTGVGQSWSQFKLADWAHPFVTLFVLLGLAYLGKYCASQFSKILVLLVASALVISCVYSIERMVPIESYYHHPTSLSQFYLNFRHKITEKCGNNRAIYLDLSGEDHKFRQMLALFLVENRLKSNWTDDGYITNSMPNYLKNESFEKGDCYVVLNENKDNSEKNFVTVMTHSRPAQLVVLSSEGAYDREQDGLHWWQWVNTQVTYKFKPFVTSLAGLKSHMEFSYGLRTPQTLTIDVLTIKNTHITFKVPKTTASEGVFSRNIAIPLREIKSVQIRADGQSKQLSETDPRIASWRILDFKLKNDVTAIKSIKKIKIIQAELLSSEGAYAREQDAYSDDADH